MRGLRTPITSKVSPKVMKEVKKEMLNHKKVALSKKTEHFRKTKFFVYFCVFKK